MNDQEALVLTDDFLVPVGFDAGEGGSAEAGGDSSGGTQSAADSSAGGTQATSDSSDALAKLEEQRRSFQSRAEKSEAESKALASRLEALEKRLSGNDGAGDAGGESLDADALLEKAHARFKREAALERAADALKGDYPHADPAILERAAEFDSPDALREAVEASHTRVASLIESEMEAREAALLERMSKEYGIRLAPQLPQGQDQGKMTLDKFRAMDFKAQGKYEADHPEVVAELLRSAI